MRVQLAGQKQELAAVRGALNGYAGASAATTTEAAARLAELEARAERWRESRVELDSTVQALGVSVAQQGRDLQTALRREAGARRAV